MLLLVSNSLGSELLRNPWKPSAEFIGAAFHGSGRRFSFGGFQSAKTSDRQSEGSATRSLNAWLCAL